MSESIKPSWHKVSFDLDATMPVGDPLELTMKANEIFFANGNPEGFAVFSAFEDEAQTYMLYFSPVAAALCAELLTTHYARPCEKPGPVTPAFNIHVGEVGAWDLLK